MLTASRLDTHPPMIIKLMPVLLSALLVSAPAWAKDPPADNRSDQRKETPLSDSVRQVERNTGGRVVGAERIERSGGRDINRVKVVTPEGRVRVIHHDPERQSQRESRKRSERDD